ncbi:hypothetical protein Hanom_Chr07g00589921 [Helianthus anomalus]
MLRCFWVPINHFNRNPSYGKGFGWFVDYAGRLMYVAFNPLKLLPHKHPIVFQAIDGANGFQNTHKPKRYESAKFSIDQVAFIVEKVRIIWEPLLLPLTYKRSMCTVVEAVCSRMTKDILQ